MSSGSSAPRYMASCQMVETSLLLLSTSLARESCDPGLLGAGDPSCMLATTSFSQVAQNCCTDLTPLPLNCAENQLRLRTARRVR